eukprot:3820411-Prymnesium_polylepis.2
MMGNTYSSTLAEARLEGRVGFARLVLGLELRAFNTPFTWLPGKRWRDEWVEKLGKLGTINSSDGQNYLTFRSYSMPIGMTHRGAHGDIFQTEQLPQAKEPPKPDVGPSKRRLSRKDSFCSSEVHKLKATVATENLEH